MHSPSALTEHVSLNLARIFLLDSVEDDDIAASGLREKPERTLLTQASLFDVVAARKALCTLLSRHPIPLLPLSAPFSPCACPTSALLSLSQGTLAKQKGPLAHSAAREEGDGTCSSARKRLSKAPLS